MKHYENPSIGVKIIELDDAYQMCTKSEMYEYPDQDCGAAESAMS